MFYPEHSVSVRTVSLRGFVEWRFQSYYSMDSTVTEVTSFAGSSLSPLVSPRMSARVVGKPSYSSAVSFPYVFVSLVQY